MLETINFTPPATVGTASLVVLRGGMPSLPESNTHPTRAVAVEIRPDVRSLWAPSIRDVSCNLEQLEPSVIINVFTFFLIDCEIER